MLKASRGSSPLDAGTPLVVDAPRENAAPAITVRSALKKSVYARKLGASTQPTLLFALVCSALPDRVLP